MILLAGDSWGCGAWEPNQSDPESMPRVAHGGLGEYLKSTHKVINLSIPGGSNWQTYLALKRFFASGYVKHLNQDITDIFVFQTEWWRDFGLRTPYPSDYSSYNFVEFDCEFPTEFVYSWYYRLSELAQENAVRIGLIGGVTDTEYFENFEKEIPRVYVACQSFVNLCINHNHLVSEKCWGLIEADAISQLKKHARTLQDLDYLLCEVDKSQQRVQLFCSHPQWFGPEYRHANQAAHFKLYQHIKQMV
jgi:hypothetical protein